MQPIKKKNANTGFTNFNQSMQTNKREKKMPALNSHEPTTSKAYANE
jgi:hypothetical protein